MRETQEYLSVSYFPCCLSPTAAIIKSILPVLGNSYRRACFLNIQKPQISALLHHLTVLLDQSPFNLRAWEMGFQYYSTGNSGTLNWMCTVSSTIARLISCGLFQMRKVKGHHDEIAYSSYFNTCTASWIIAVFWLESHTVRRYSQHAKYIDSLSYHQMIRMNRTQNHAHCIIFCAISFGRFLA